VSSAGAVQIFSTEQNVNLSEEAFSFFREWMSLKTNLSVMMVLQGVVINSLAVIQHLDAGSLQVSSPDLKFSALVPLTGCVFSQSDPEVDTNSPALDDAIRGAGFKFGWEILLPSNDRVVLAEFDDLPGEPAVAT
jgi:hypothetical protein